MKATTPRTLQALCLSVILLIVGCTSPFDQSTDTIQDASIQSNATESKIATESKEVNLYTSRHYDADDKLFSTFKQETGITVNVVKGKADELLQRLKTEGTDTQADLFMAADAGRLHNAKSADLLQAVESEILQANIPANLRDDDNYWFGLTKRARVIVYAKDRVNPTELSTYEDLANPKWKGKILVRSADNIYNQSLIASFIEIMGKDKAKNIATGIVANLARDPKGGDRDQAKAIAAGEGDIAIMNTYYFGHLMHSADPEERKVAEKLAVFFPDQHSSGTHINLSGAGIVKGAKNKENALKLLEFLASSSSQQQFAATNYEYPVHPNVEPSDFLKSLGSFKEQSIRLSKLGVNNATSVKLLHEVGWK